MIWRLDPHYFASSPLLKQECSIISWGGVRDGEGGVLQESSSCSGSVVIHKHASLIKASRGIVSNK